MFEASNQTGIHGGWFEDDELEDEVTMKEVEDEVEAELKKEIEHNSYLALLLDCKELFEDWMNEDKHIIENVLWIEQNHIIEEIINQVEQSIEEQNYDSLNYNNIKKVDYSYDEVDNSKLAKIKFNYKGNSFDVFFDPVNLIEKNDFGRNDFLNIFLPKAVFPLYDMFGNFHDMMVALKKIKRAIECYKKVKKVKMIDEIGLKKIINWASACLNMHHAFKALPYWKLMDRLNQVSTIYYQKKEFFDIEDLKTDNIYTLEELEDFVIEDNIDVLKEIIKQKNYSYGEVERIKNAFYSYAYDKSKKPDGDFDLDVYHAYLDDF